MRSLMMEELDRHPALFETGKNPMAVTGSYAPGKNPPLSTCLKALTEQLESADRQAALQERRRASAAAKPRESQQISR